MRRSIALTLIGLVAATPLAAQFEGTVTMKMAANAGAQGGGDMTMKISVKGNKSATVMTMPASAGPMAGMEVRSIYDPATNMTTTLMPMPAGMGASMPGMADAKGIKMVMDLSKMQAANGGSNDANVSVKPLGTSQTIIGMKCDDYEVTNGKGDPMRMCVTAAMGTFHFPQTMGGGRRGGSTNPAWAEAFGNKPMFPLKVWSTDGKMAMEVTAIDKGAVPASVFDIPDGYMDMSAMMGGMRGRPPLQR